MCLISPRYINEVEVRIGDNLVEEIIGEVIDLLIEIIVKAIDDMKEVEVILGEEIFEEEVIFKVDIIIGWIEVGKTEDYGGNLGQEKEKGVGRHLVLDWGPELVLIENRTRCFKCREYDHFANECPNLILDSSDRDSDSARSVYLHLADSDTGSDIDHYLNI